MERTLAIIKPDAVGARHTGRIIQRIEDAGFQIRAMRMLHLSGREAEGFYAVHRERPFFGSLTQFMSRGPVVVLAASTGAFRGSIAHPAMKRHLLAAASAEDIPVQLATHLARGSTEAASIHLVREGIPTISVGVPRRYSYSPNEMIDLDDAAAAVRLLVRFVAEMERHGDLGFA